MAGKWKTLMMFVAGISLLSLRVSAQSAPGQAAAPSAPGQPAAQTPQAATASPRRPPGPDQELVAQLRQLGQDEIGAAKVAQERATSPRVKAFALTVQRDHRIANDQLEAYAAHKNMNLTVVKRPGDALPHDQLANAPLLNATREEFDSKFMTRMVTDHQAAIDAAAAAQRLARDPELKGMIGSLLVTLSDHQTAAQELAAQIPAPAPRVVQLPAYPPGVSRTQTGADVPPPAAVEQLAQPAR
jgi:putative membrane protein